MKISLNELQSKEVINLADGLRLGRVSDVEIDIRTAIVESIRVERKRGWGWLFEKSDEIVIPWGNIDVIGIDAILVRANEAEIYNKIRAEKRKRFPKEDFWK